MKRSFIPLVLTLLFSMGACSTKTADSGDSSAETTSATTTATGTTATTGTTTTTPTTTSTSSSSTSGTTETDETRTGPGGDRPERTPCETDEDCIEACPPGSLDCVCHESPREDKVCVPTCNTDDDCPETPSDSMICDEAEGICIREGGPGGGGGPGT